MVLDPLMLDILACPEDKGPLYYFEDEASLFNPRLDRRYRIDKGIPVLLIDEAEALDAAETQRLNDRIAAEGIRPTFVR